MRVMKVGLILVVVVIFAAVPARAQTWYYGGGLDSVDLGGDFLLDDAIGFAINVGYNFSPTTALDMVLGFSTHEQSFFGYDVDYTRFSIGPKFVFGGSTTKPWATVGLMSNSLENEFGTETVDGTGLFLGLGADIPVGPNGAISIGYRFSSWDADSNLGGSFDGETNVLSVYYVFKP
jgi:hypothetical protein